MRGKMPGLPKVCSSVSVRSNRYGYLYLGLGGRHAGRGMMGRDAVSPPWWWSGRSVVPVPAVPKVAPPMHQPAGPAAEAELTSLQRNPGVTKTACREPVSVHQTSVTLHTHTITVQHSAA